MPVVELSTERLCTLIGRDIGTDKLVESISRLGGDVENIGEDKITVEFFPDRPDLLSVEGTARALRAFLGIEKGLKEYQLSDSEVEMGVDKNILPIRPYIACLDVKGVSLDDDMVSGLMEMQEDLHWALGRDRKKVAIGVHDSSKITPPYVYRAALPDEIGFVPLGSSEKMTLGEILKRHPKGVEYAHVIENFPRYPIILDSKGEVLSMPPIINGELTKLSLDTREIFVEMTGTDEGIVNRTMNILASAFGECGWRLFKTNIRYPDRTLKTPDFSPEKWGVSLSYINKMLGLNLSYKGAKDCLERTGYGVGGGDKKILVHVPAYRADIIHEIDIVEDVAIGYGYYRCEPVLPLLSTTGSRLDIEIPIGKARMTMLGLGFSEIKTLMLSNEKQNNERMGIKDGAVKLENPLSEEHTLIRTHLLPGLLEVLYLNRHRELPQRIFEVGEVLKLDSKSETGARRELRLCGCIVHPKANFSEATSIFSSVLRVLGIEGKMKGLKNPAFIDGRCAGIEGAGYYGELHPRVLTSFGLEYPAAAMEIIIK